MASLRELLTTAPQVSELRRIAAMSGGPSLTAYQPTLRERLGGYIYDMANRSGLTGQANRMRDEAQSVMDFIPGIGDMIGVQEAGQDYQAGNYLGAGMGGLAAAIGLVPGVGDALGKAVKEGGETVQKGIRAYHGSPHDFDKFDMSKIGTGEGAQAYGHGLYFAENEEIAKNYRDTLRKSVTYKGRPISSIIFPHRDNLDVAAIGIAQYLNEKNLDEVPSIIAAKIKSLRDEIDYHRKRGESDLSSYLEQDISDLEALNPKDFGYDPGRMYEVNINANPDDFLDWDAPLSQQPESVRRLAEGKVDVKPQFHFNGSYGSHSVNNGGVITKVSTVKPNIGGGFDASFRGESLGAFPSGDAAQQAIEKRMVETGFYFEPKGDEIYSALVGRSPLVSDVRAPAPSVDQLRQAGIPGIKYRDAGSRGADGGNNTRNYVVFDDNLISIVRKYGIAGAIGLGLLTREQGEAMAAQGYE